MFMQSHRAFNSVAHAKGQWFYHVEFCPKYRYRLLRKESSQRDMRAILMRIAQENKIHIEELAVESDHVHVVMSIPPSMSLSHATLLLKGRSSYEFRKLHPNIKLRVAKHFWSEGKFYRTVGDVDLETTKEYVRAHNDVSQRKLSEFVGTPGL